MTSSNLSSRLAPWLFVWIWSTGYLAAKYGLPYAEPFTLLAYRFALTLLFLAPIVFVLKRPWPRSRRAILHLSVVGLLIHGIYLGGIFQAIKWGMPAGLSAMIIGLQPLGMAMVASIMLNEAVSKRQWLGLGLGLLGLYFVLFERFNFSGATVLLGFPIWALVIMVVSLLSISLGVIYQKRYCSDMDIISGTLIQYSSAFLFTVAVVSVFEAGVVEWTLPFVATLAWQVLGLSIGAILLLMAMIRKDASVQVASYFYLVAPLVALQAWYLFDETLGFASAIGVVLIAFGVSFARPSKDQQSGNNNL
ncbi:MAG: DMT family transporter [Gammaproteobacteria bacterium]